MLTQIQAAQTTPEVKCAIDLNDFGFWIFLAVIFYVMMK